MKKLLILILTVVSSASIYAQQEAMFTHYSFNTLAVNSGYAGSRDALTVTGLHRSQWVSFPGAPQTQTITAHAPLFNQKIGLGLSVLNDKIGPTQQTAFYADFAYKIKLGNGKLAFGLKGGANMVATDLKELSTQDDTDPQFQENIQSQFLPNFGFGLYYSTPKYYLGVSTPRLLENNYETNSTTGSVGGERRHYYFIGGVVFPINKTETIKLRPTAYLKVTEGAPIEADLTALFYFQDKYWAGPMFRTGDAFGVLAGLNITDQFSFGYSFDWSFTNTTVKYNGGSHELMLRYDFMFNNKGKIKSPRYF
ncbi:MAG: PorP/SprF family type IX secretion system membrane protein [Putridiphycobacter sp.]